MNIVENDRFQQFSISIFLEKLRLKSVRSKIDDNRRPQIPKIEHQTIINILASDSSNSVTISLKTNYLAGYNIPHQFHKTRTVINNITTNNIANIKQSMIFDV
jgi:hypothetical protein